MTNYSLGEIATNVSWIGDPCGGGLIGWAGLCGIIDGKEPS